MENNNTDIKTNFYISTPIFYPNGDLHIGHAYNATICDIFARMARLNDMSTYFLTGADENSIKIQKKADELKMSVMDFLDEQAKNSMKLFENIDISFDQYIRTTDVQKHHAGAIFLWNKLMENDDLYTKDYEGYYCTGCESFKTEKDLVNGLCPDHNIKPELIKEKNYFFRLSKYQDQIKDIIQNDKIKIFPEERKNEILSFIDNGIEDISFSRPYKGQDNVIKVPGDDDQGIYVWCDALVNYISALGYGSLGQNLPESIYNKFWNNENSQSVHVIGKDILKFHAIIWPAMLLGAKIPLPKNIIIHGLMLSDGRKMSKTMGNVISPKDIIETVGSEGMRFYFAYNIPIFNDGEISKDLILSSYNSHLSNGIGNLTNRLIKMMLNYDINIEFKNIENDELYIKLSDKMQKTLKNFDINSYADLLWKEFSNIDLDIQNREPFKLFKTDPDKARQMVSEMLRNFYIIITFTKPILPKTVSRIISCINNREMPETALFPRV